MGRETKLFKSEERKNRADLSNFLHQLADKIANGKVVLSQGAEKLVLLLPQNVILRMMAQGGFSDPKPPSRELPDGSRFAGGESLS